LRLIHEKKIIVNKTKSNKEDLNAYTSYGATALIYAVVYNNPIIITFLLERGARSDIGCYYVSSLRQLLDNPDKEESRKAFEAFNAKKIEMKMKEVLSLQTLHPGPTGIMSEYATRDLL